MTRPLSSGERPARQGLVAVRVTYEDARGQAATVPVELDPLRLRPHLLDTLYRFRRLSELPYHCCRYRVTGPGRVWGLLLERSRDGRHRLGLSWLTGAGVVHLHVPVLLAGWSLGAEPIGLPSSCPPQLVDLVGIWAEDPGSPVRVPTPQQGQEYTAR